MKKITANKDSKVNEILVENVRLTNIEDGVVKLIGASNAAEVDKVLDKVVLKLAVMEEMFEAGQLQIQSSDGVIARMGEL